jgi:hypothetical protein
MFCLGTDFREWCGSGEKKRVKEGRNTSRRRERVSFWQKNLRDTKEELRRMKSFKRTQSW